MIRCTHSMYEYRDLTYKCPVHTTEWSIQKYKLEPPANILRAELASYWSEQTVQRVPSLLTRSVCGDTTNVSDQ